LILLNCSLCIRWYTHYFILYTSKKGDYESQLLLGDSLSSESDYYAFLMRDTVPRIEKVYRYSFTMFLEFKALWIRDIILELYLFGLLDSLISDVIGLLDELYIVNLLDLGLHEKLVLLIVHIFICYKRFTLYFIIWSAHDPKWWEILQIKDNINDIGVKGGVDKTISLKNHVFTYSSHFQYLLLH
jgi:hypothetical protein